MSLLAIIGIEVALLGLVAFGVAPRLRRRWPSLVALTAIVPSLVLIVGIGLVGFSVFGGATPLSGEANPVPGTVTSVDTGNRLYQANCAACHGVDGEGGGPLANTTPIQPPSLKAHLSQHTDGDLFYWITNGLPGGMPAWAATLSPTDRWNVINYLRAINETSASIAPASTAPSATSDGAPAPAGSVLAIVGLPLAWSTLLVGLLGVRRRRSSARHPRHRGQPLR